MPSFTLESGRELNDVTVRYRTYGTLSEERDNALIVTHALTGNASLESWRGTLLGEGRAFDTSKYYVICANVLGSCYVRWHPHGGLSACQERHLPTRHTHL